MKKIKVKKQLKRVGGFFGEFKTFVMRGNVLDLAIGVIIGGAFQKITTSLVNDILMPLLSLASSSTLDLSSLFIALDGKSYDSLAQAKESGAAVLTYGSFLTVIMDFILMAAAVYLIIKAINAISHIRDKNNDLIKIVEAEKKTCPYCKSSISPGATRCPNCTSQLDLKDEIDDITSA